jgi:polar amino acid transport system substrate-binding protein
MQPSRDDRRLADLVPTGALHVGLFPSFLYRKKADGTLDGVAIEIAEVLAASIDVKLVPREYSSPPDVVRALRTGKCDVAFLGIDPMRAADVDFTQPYMQADFTFLVPDGSPIDAITDADRSGIRIAIVRDHAMDAALRGKLTQAQRVYAPTPDAAFELLRGGHADVLAGIRPGLLRYVSQLPGGRVLADRYGANLLAFAVAKDCPQRLAFVNEFVQRSAISGLVQRCIENAGLHGIDAIR